MSTQPPFAAWLQKSLSSLFGALTNSEDSSVFSAQFERAVSPHALVYLNHQEISVGTLEDHIRNEAILANQVAEAELDWKEIFGVKQGDEEGGLVVGHFIVVRTMKFRIRAAPAKHLGYKFFSAKIIKDTGVQPDEEGNHWRISQLFLTEVERPAPISLHPVEL